LLIKEVKSSFKTLS